MSRALRQNVTGPQIENGHTENSGDSTVKGKTGFTLARKASFIETSCVRIVNALTVLALLAIQATGAERKQAPANKIPESIALSSADRAALESGAAELARKIESLRQKLDAKFRPLLPDVEIYWKAVDWAIRYSEFHRSNEITIARSLLKQGMERASALDNGNAPWLTATGLVVRGYISHIDGSVQPYGLVVPASFRPGTGHRHRLDVWLHGRDDGLTELKFINDRQRSNGEFTPADTIVLHPYGRLCNAFKFAGEQDVFEGIAHVKQNYPIDEERIALRGFSMGGAGTWHLAAHHAGYWTAAAPGAGFAETAQYTKALEKDPLPPWYEQQLWHLYDATDYAANLFNCGLIAYSGELDPQKQAADMMSKAMEAEGLNLRHLIGPQVQHKYEPETKKELAKQFDALMAQGKERVPKRVRLTTFTLRYHQQEWVTVDEMEKHWQRARVDAELQGSSIIVRTDGVRGLTLDLPADTFGAEPKVTVKLDAQTIAVSKPDGNWQLHFMKADGKWREGRNRSIHKTHGLQGPIDDSFMEPFLFVRPTGKPLSEEAGRWVESEFARATNAWRAQFRGYVPVKKDTEVQEEDFRRSNLVLWGDPGSNKLIAKMANRLPVRWSKGQIQLGGKSYSEQFAPVLIFPNPLNPGKDVVLNSGFTFSEVAKASNALQTPKLPDYALLDMTIPPADRLAHGVKEAGFFNDQWQLK